MTTDWEYYTVCEAETPEALQDEVESSLEFGMQLHGGLVAVWDANANSVKYLQAMVGHSDLMRPRKEQ